MSIRHYRNIMVSTIFVLFLLLKICMPRFYHLWPIGSAVISSESASNLNWFLRLNGHQTGRSETYVKRKIVKHSCCVSVTPLVLGRLPNGPTFHTSRTLTAAMKSLQIHSDSWYSKGNPKVRSETLCALDSKCVTDSLISLSMTPKNWYKTGHHLWENDLVRKISCC